MKNKFTAIVQEITSAQGSTHMRFALGDTPIRVITLQPPIGLTVGSNATLFLHETRPILTNEPLEGIANTLWGHIERIDTGEILTRIFVKTKELTVSVLTDTPTFQASSWIIDQKIYLCFKATDIAIEVNR